MSDEEMLRIKQVIARMSNEDRRELSSFLQELPEDREMEARGSWVGSLNEQARGKDHSMEKIRDSIVEGRRREL